ncbi:histidine kinase [Pseudonocardia eucalypti]|uniref:histidine kinase n=1 Tax=Pseudonocardia eucalypti TaxID=648755 RepID=A0ABP9PTI6_9PSEU|nr:signal transduction histidine kinase [Pseudonocardia eucalypti]
MNPASPRREGPVRLAGTAPSRAESVQWRRRQRLERQLHDGASLRLSALALRLGLLRQRRPGEDEAWRADIGELQEELHTVLQELRDVANQIYPPLLDQAGLGPALAELAERRGAQIRLDVPKADRFGPEAEGAAYFAVAECLVVRPPDAGPLAVTARRNGTDLVLTLCGLDPDYLLVLEDHAAPLGGTVDRHGPEASDTITVRIPCE